MQMNNSREVCFQIQLTMDIKITCSSLVYLSNTEIQIYSVWWQQHQERNGFTNLAYERTALKKHDH